MTLPVTEFLSKMRHLAGAVNVITTRQGEVRAGLTATAVCSVTAEPPRLFACVNKTAGAHDLIVASGIFCVNILGKDHIPLAMRFSGLAGIDGDARFHPEDKWIKLKTGAPALDDALACFDCALFQTLDLGTHTAFIGDVLAAAGTAGDPLIYLDSTYSTVRKIEHPRFHD